MEQRQRNILEAIIKEYSETILPVSSQLLVDKYCFNIKPATMRLEMVELTDEGFLEQPHTSAGRVPTDKAYRFFVDSLIDEQTPDKQNKIKFSPSVKCFQKIIKGKTKRVNRELARAIADIVHQLSIAIDLDDERGFYEAGLSWLLREPEFNQGSSMADLLETLESFDKEISKIFNPTQDKLQIIIGRENPNHKLKNCSLIIRSFNTPWGERGLISILGPKRMDYARNISLINYLSDNLS